MCEQEIDGINYLGSNDELVAISTRFHPLTNGFLGAAVLALE
jgi:hypothetical protein